MSIFFFFLFLSSFVALACIHFDEILFLDFNVDYSKRAVSSLHFSFLLNIYPLPTHSLQPSLGYFQRLLYAVLCCDRFTPIVFFYLSLFVCSLIHFRFFLVTFVNGIYPTEFTNYNVHTKSPRHWCYLLHGSNTFRFLLQCNKHNETEVRERQSLWHSVWDERVRCVSTRVKLKIETKSTSI